MHEQQLNARYTMECKGNKKLIRQEEQLKQLQLGFIFSELQASADPESFQNVFCLGIVSMVWVICFLYSKCNVLDKILVHLRHGQGKETWQGKMGLYGYTIVFTSSLF